MVNQLWRIKRLCGFTFETLYPKREADRELLSGIFCGIIGGLLFALFLILTIG